MMELGLQRFRVDWNADAEPYKKWVKETEEPRQEHLIRNAVQNDCGSSPLISIVMPVYNTPAQYLRAALESIVSQVYQNWQLCVVDDASDASDVKDVLQEFVERDERVCAFFRETNGGIAVATNDALTMSGGQYVAFMDHDDILSNHALLVVASELYISKEVKILYSDSDRLNAQGERVEPFFKPDWNYDLFLGQNYLNHLSIYRMDLVKSLGGLREGFDGSQDYDFALRAVEKVKSSEIVHIPEILYHWRLVDTAVSQTSLGDAVRAARRAIKEHIKRTNQIGIIRPVKLAVIYSQILWQIPEPLPKVTIVLHGENREKVDRSAKIVEQMTHFNNFNIIKTIVEAPDVSGTDLGGVLNSVSFGLDTDVICFIQDGCLPTEENWLDILVGQALRKTVGVVGCKFCSRQGEVLSGPLVIERNTANNNFCIGLAFKGAEESSKGYFSRLVLDHCATAIHGACFAAKYSDFCMVGGLDQALSDLTLLGADLSLKFEKSGLSVIWSANVSVRCSDTVVKNAFSSKALQKDAARFANNWLNKLSSDTYYNSNFIGVLGNYGLAID